MFLREEGTQTKNYYRKIIIILKDDIEPSHSNKTRQKQTKKSIYKN